LSKYEKRGINFKEVSFDLSRIMQEKENIVKELCNGIDQLMSTHKIDVIKGSGTLLNNHEVEILQNETEKRITQSGKNIILATGSTPIDLPFASADGVQILNSTHMLSLEQVPEKMIIAGAGVIGIELGSVWKRLGADVTIIELMPQFLPMADRQVSQFGLRYLKAQGLNFYFGEKIESISKENSEITVNISDANQNKKSYLCNQLFIAAGRKPLLENVLGKNSSVSLDKKGKIIVNKNYETTLPGVYAIGDIIDGPMLAHKAEKEGVAVAEIISGNPYSVNYRTIPNVIYTLPEIAWFGETEEQLTGQNISYKTGKAYFKPNGRAKAMSEEDGFIKIIVSSENDLILGAHIVGAQASELIHVLSIAMQNNITSKALAQTCFAHPSLSEILNDALHSIR